MNITVTRIKELVSDTGITVRDLADAAGCSKSAMQRYISGEREIPTNIISGIAGAFNVHPAYLLGWVDEKNYQPNKKARQIMIDEQDYLTDTQKELLAFVESVPEEKAGKLLQAMKLFLAD